ncbi:uncharacterized protein LOC113234436 [Hyposmocoma kahamanoa]|uniref:uncharacterized protein LOC113234436 n=1 Tax=Hyposmocoma kahamanoa TaxID=1477025 RepID=UPI000E6D9F26|nr:uncharacterized protein LOC113234436 [Hyposmocoma kahamanoa]
MQTTSRDKLQDLQTIITKMPLSVICVSVLPEFGVRWREVSRAVRNCRLPMVPASVARVICRHAGNSLPEDEIGDIVARLRLKFSALGFKTYEDAKLFGRDIHSLLRIHDRANNENVNHLAEIPEYNPIPIVTKSANTVTIDYTNRNYNEQYVDNLLGPDPPLLTDLIVNSTENFFDPSRLQKRININVQLKSEDVAKTLKVWVSKGAIPPTSLFFNIFRKIKSNKFSIDGNVDD